ncbi:MAG TPA: response regulator [Thiobacillaceae bacterium]|nr:response regulator [Thiobacillaceae bacterium]HNU63703.1 response regulator [Thiobacillaceae bacterium]
MDYKVLKGLVIDDFPSMRSAFKSALASFGMTRVDVAGTAAEAIARIKGQRYDIIICDYNLGEGRNGQQLLEELRQRGMLDLESVFLMVTAESMYESVVATAELGPDDYLIKPFNGDMLRCRLDAILPRKQTFQSVYRHFKHGNLEAALSGCDVILREHPKYIVDVLRLKGEILVTMGEFEQAEELYKQIVAMRAVPWSKLGLAKAMHLQGKSAAAEALLLDIIGRHPNMVASYDLLADVQLAQNKAQEAQGTLQRGAAVSSKSPKRQRRLGEIALQNNDLATAEKAFRATLEKGRNSIYLVPNDVANLSRVYLKQGKPRAASEVVMNNREFLHESRDGKLVAAVMLSQVSARNDDTENARARIREAMRLREDGVVVDLDLDLDMLEACVKAGMEEEANHILTEVARNAHDHPTLLDQARRLYAEAGRQDVAETVLRQATARVIELSREGALLLKKGELRQSLEKMLLACQEAARNPRILMNAAWVSLRLLEEEGLSQNLLSQAQRLLADVDRLAPEHPRLAGLRTTLRQFQTQMN